MQFLSKYEHRPEPPKATLLGQAASEPRLAHDIDESILEAKSDLECRSFADAYRDNASACGDCITYPTGAIRWDFKPSHRRYR
jgi:hypothetical protein